MALLGAFWAGLGQGLQDPRCTLFWELLRLLKWWQHNEVNLVAYVFENVLLSGIVNAQVQDDARVVCLHLGELMLVDVAALLKLMM